MAAITSVDLGGPKAAGTFLAKAAEVAAAEADVYHGRRGMNRAPKRVVLLQDVSADETTSIAVDLRGYACAAMYLGGSGTISSGVVEYETSSPDPAHPGMLYGGTWSNLASVNASDVTGGAQKRTALTPGAFAFVRARITTVLGGTLPLISVVLEATE